MKTMLVLSRKKGESIVIQDNIEVTILDIEADTIKIGIAAPKQVSIYRKELYEAIKKSNVESSQHHVDIGTITKDLKKFKK